MSTNTRRRIRAGVAGTATLSLLFMVPPVHADPDPGSPDVDASSTVSTHSVTLVTGDVVRFTLLAEEEQPVISLEPDGPSQGVASIERGETGTVVIPAAAMAAYAEEAVDPALFALEDLIAQGYDDAAAPNLPLVLDGDRGKAQPKAKGGAREQSRLESIDALAVDLRKEQARAFWQAHDTPAERAAAGVSKIWLDAQVKVDLAESVPQIGAPEGVKAGETDSVRRSV